MATANEKWRLHWYEQAARTDGNAHPESLKFASPERYATSQTIQAAVMVQRPTGQSRARLSQLLARRNPRLTRLETALGEWTT